ncbi:hypothetical protein KBY88_04645 [Cyanobium sp. Morenito 9A2]|nr:hypothetical protein [Cyanobium sp. Morenito 9A2]
MGNCVVVVLADRGRLHRLRDQLAQISPPPTALVAVGDQETDALTVARLNPAIGRRLRQRSMARWLLPFGFAAGLTFTQITDLQTFAFLGPWGEPLVGGLLGLAAGWMGSFAAAASIVPEDDDRLRSLRNRLNEGNWLLVVETPRGVELGWTLLQKAGAETVVTLAET